MAIKPNKITQKLIFLSYSLYDTNTAPKVMAILKKVKNPLGRFATATNNKTVHIANILYILPKIHTKNKYLFYVKKLYGQHFLNIRHSGQFVLLPQGPNLLPLLPLP